MELRGLTCGVAGGGWGLLGVQYGMWGESGVRRGGFQRLSEAGVGRKVWIVRGVVRVRWGEGRALQGEGGLYAGSSVGCLALRWESKYPTPADKW